MPQRSATPPLSEAERQRTARLVAAASEQIPDAIAFARDLYALGLIDGLRAITYAGPVRPKTPGALSAHDLCLVTAKQMADESKRYGRARG